MRAGEAGRWRRERSRPRHRGGDGGSSLSSMKLEAQGWTTGGRPISHRGRSGRGDRGRAAREKGAQRALREGRQRCVFQGHQGQMRYRGRSARWTSAVPAPILILLLSRLEGLRQEILHLHSQNTCLGGTDGTPGSGIDLLT